MAFRDGGRGEKVTLFGLLGALRPVVLLGEGSLSVELLRELRGRDLDIRVIAAPKNGSLGVNPNCLEDVHGSFRAIYGMKGDFLCLIRPDGHIGLFQQKVDVASLRSYLDMLGPKREEGEVIEPLAEIANDEIDSSEFVEIDDPELSAVR